MSNTSLPAIPKTDAEWKAALDSLPATPDNIPSFYFGHGSPMLVLPQGKNMPLPRFLKDFGPTLLKKYKPKGILVFSGHFESQREYLVTDYGDDQPLHYDYYGFPHEMYEIKFSSNGSSELSQRVVDAFSSAGLRARMTTRSEPRGLDGRGFKSPGLDHGVFLPFRIMFGDTFHDVPIVEASIDSSLTPEKNWAIGQAVAPLRKEGILILAGGLTVHNLRDFSALFEDKAKPAFRKFNEAVNEAALQPKPKLKDALVNLAKHESYNIAHPREDHFVPIYVAAGAGEEGETKLVAGIYGSQTIAFGL